MINQNIEITRVQQMLYKVVIIDGFPGSGKTMLSPIISSFDRVEIMEYTMAIENICQLSLLAKIDDDVAKSMIKMKTDRMIYNVSMGRRTNCRPRDLSSIFRHKPLKYIKRMLSSGDTAIPDKILRTKPILHLATHSLLPSYKLLFEALDEKLIFYQVIRHPLYMIIQDEKNFEIFEGLRNFNIRYSSNLKEYNYFTLGWEDIYDKSNSFEKAIYHMKWYFDYLFELNDQRVKIIPFEIFVKNPEMYINEISNNLGSPITNNVKKEMIRQKVPRKLINDGPELDIYKRCGWEPPKYFSEEKELEARRKLVSMNVSKKALSILDDLSESYEKKFLS